MTVDLQGYISSCCREHELVGRLAGGAGHEVVRRWWSTLKESDLFDVGVAQHTGCRQFRQDIGERHPEIAVSEREWRLGGIPHLLETTCSSRFCVGRSRLANPANFRLVERGKHDT